MINKNLIQERINFKYNLSLYFKFLKKYKFIFIIILILSLLIEGIHLTEKYFFKLIIDHGTKYSSNNLAYLNFIGFLIIILFSFIVILILKVIFDWLKNHYLFILESELIYDLKEKFFNHVLDLSYNFHTSHKTGTLISRLNRGKSAIEGLTDTIILNFSPAFFELVIVITSLIYLDMTSSIIIFATVILFVSYSFFLQRSQEDSNIKANEAEDIEKANISDIFTNIESIKYFGKEKTIKERFSNLSKNSKESLLKFWNYYRWLDSIQLLILGLGTLFLIFFSIKKYLYGDLSLGTIAFIYTVYTSLVSSMYHLVYGIRTFYKVMADLDSLSKYLLIENEIKDKPNSKKLEIKSGEIEFKDVDFYYGKRKIFENFILKIPKNAHLAIVGHSGSGKTTLIKLLYRLYDLSRGEIKIDGENITDFKQESLRSEMSIVPQECVLFDDTIFNNILFSNPKASKEDVWNAIKLAQLTKTIENLPNKENTIVGDRGIKLSGGEKQRVSIARAILADKRILILDEATSSLDSKTESEISQSLQELMKGRTVIVIAHRLSTIMKADKIIVMDKGKIIEQGTHSELVNISGEYQKLWSLQKDGYIK
jgi:ATP-binding cassette subfamily B protein